MVLEGDVAELAEGTPLLRAQINNYWSRGFESLRLRQELSWQKPTKHKDRQRSFFVFCARRIALPARLQLQAFSFQIPPQVALHGTCRTKQPVPKRNNFAENLSQPDPQTA